MWSYIRLQDCLKSIDYQFLPNGFNCVRSSTVCVTTSVEKEVVVYTTTWWNWCVVFVCTGREHSEVTWHRWLSVKKASRTHNTTGLVVVKMGEVVFPSSSYSLLPPPQQLCQFSEALIQQARVDLTTSIWTLFAREFSDVYYALEVP